MGRTCQICGRSRPNEQFGGSGQSAMVCSECRQRIPKKERRRILAIEEMHGFLSQSNISAKNIKRLNELGSIEDTDFQTLRTLTLEIAIVLPKRRRRWSLLRQNRSDLYLRIVDSGLFDYLLDEYCHDPTFYDDELTEDQSFEWENCWFKNEEP